MADVEYIDDVTGRVRTRLGHWIYFDPRDKRGQVLAKKGGNVYPNTMRAWDILLGRHRWTHVIDVGANYGEMLVNSTLPQGAQIIAIEPNPACRAYLERTLLEAGIAATVLPTALSDSEGERELIVPLQWSGHARLAREDETGTLRVNTTTLGALLCSAGPLGDMSVAIKIDVEGDEAAVLRGAEREISRLKAFGAIVEILHAPETELDWLEQRFEIGLLDLVGSATLHRLAMGDLRPRLATGAYYKQDVALFRRMAARNLRSFVVAALRRALGRASRRERPTAY